MSSIGLYKHLAGNENKLPFGSPHHNEPAVQVIICMAWYPLDFRFNVFTKLAIKMASIFLAQCVTANVALRRRIYTIFFIC